MKQETRYKLKRYAKYAYYGVIALCWLMALVGVSAYAIYQCKLLADYKEPQAVEKVPTKHFLADDNISDYIYYAPRPLSYYNSNDFADGLEVYSPDITTRYNLYFTFYFQQNDDITEISCSRFYGAIEYKAGQYLQGCYFDSISFFTDSGSRYFVLTNNNSGFTDTSWDYTLNDFSYVRMPKSFLNENPTFKSLLSFVFEPIYDTDFITPYTLDFNNIMFTQLLSYSRITGYDLVVDGSGFGAVLEIPFTFRYNDRLYESILLKYSRIIFYLDNDNSPQRYDGITGSTTSYITGVTSVYFLEYGGSYESYNPWGNNNPSHLYEYLIGNVLQVAYREVVAYQSYDNYMHPVFNYNNNYWNTYRNVSYDIDIYTNDLNYIPFPTSSSSDVTYPLSNITIQEILDYVGRFNYDAYGNSYNSDIGLSNVFSLIGNAFSGLTSLMAINVIPGITLGLLLFLPLVITIIIVILRLVKK